MNDPHRDASDGGFQPCPAELAQPSMVAARQRAGLGRWGLIGVAALFALGKLKWVLAALKFAKLGTLLSMLVTVGVYAQFFGWTFAVGFVLLIFVHEMGHAVALKHQGIPAGAPVFIPFVGAVIAMKGRPRDAWVEAIVGIGGPVLGTVGALGCLVAAFLADSPFFFALASTGFLLNLFNMIPISPLDGGRVAGAISRWFWLVGLALGGGLFWVTTSPILGLILLLGVLTVWRTWKHPVPGYYAITPGQRATMGLSYFWLLGVLVVGMIVAEGGVGPMRHAANLGHLAAAATTLGGVWFSRALDARRLPHRPDQGAAPERG